MLGSHAAEAPVLHAHAHDGPAAPPAARPRLRRVQELPLATRAHEHVADLPQRPRKGGARDLPEAYPRAKIADEWHVMHDVGHEDARRDARESAPPRGQMRDVARAGGVEAVG